MRCDVFAGTLQWTPTTCPACPCVLELSLRIPLCLSLRFSFSFSLLLGSCTCNHRTDMCKQDNVHDQLQDEVSHQEHTTTCPPPPSAQVHAPLSTSLSLSLSLSLNALCLIQAHSHPLYVVQVDACTVCAYMGLSTCPAGNTQVSTKQSSLSISLLGSTRHLPMVT